jgi:hypothetical protein
LGKYPTYFRSLQALVRSARGDLKQTGNVFLVGGGTFITAAAAAHDGKVLRIGIVKEHLWRHVVTRRGYAFASVTKGVESFVNEGANLPHTFILSNDCSLS